MAISALFRINTLDKSCALLGVLVAIILAFYFGILVNNPSYFLVAILILIACTIWFFIRIDQFKDIPFSGSWRFKKTQILSFFLLFIASILSVYFRANTYERPLIYFVITSLMAGIVACEILYAQNNGILILSEIVLLGVSIAGTQLLIFPNLVGNDPWYHYSLTTQILSIHHIPEGSVYSYFPLFHLIVSETSLITGLDYKMSVILSVSLGQIICNVLFIYLIGKHLMNSPKVGLLAALMVVIANYHIFMTVWSIPNALAVIFIPMLIFVLLFHSRRHSAILYIISFVLSSAIILTHTIAAMCAMIFLFEIWLGMTIYTHSLTRSSIHVFSFLIPFGFSVMLFSWWDYVSKTILTLGQLLNMGFSMSDIFNRAPVEFRDYVLNVPLFEQIFNNLGMFLFFALSIIGVLYMISRNGNRLTFIIALIGITPLIVSFFSLATGHSILDQRWWYVAQIFLSIPLGIGLLILSMSISKKKAFIASFILFTVVLLCFINIMSPAAQMDNDIFTPNINMRLAPIESELSATTILSQYNGICLTDSFFALRVYSVLGYHTDPFCQEILNHNISDLKGGIVLVRSDILTGPFILFSSTYELDFDLRAALEDTNFSQIYDSGSVYAYL